MQDIIAKFSADIRAFFTQATADMALRVLGALAMLLLGRFIIRRVMRVIDRSTGRSKLDQGIVSFLSSLISITLHAVLIVSIATYLGVPSTSFIAILSSVGLAVGLALQGSLSNFAGGLMLLLFHPFRVGDYIKSGDVEGTVVSMNIMYTQLSTFDKKKVVVPNSVLSSGVVTNFSAYDSRRIDVAVPLLPGAPVEQVKALMKQVALDHPLVLQSPAPDARMQGVTDGLLHFVLVAWCKTADFWPVTYDLQEGVTRALAQQGLAPAPPRRAVQMQEEAHS